MVIAINLPGLGWHFTASFLSENSTSNLLSLWKTVELSFFHCFKFRIVSFIKPVAQPRNDIPDCTTYLHFTDESNKKWIIIFSDVLVDFNLNW